jgi:hypothetical protein
MKRKLKIVMVVLLVVSIFVEANMVTAKTSDEIIFKDKNLQNALSKYYDWNGVFTKEKAGEISKKEDNIFLDYSDISDLEGLQYFKNVIQVNLSGNSINNVNVLPQLKNYII